MNNYRPSTFLPPITANDTGHTKSTSNSRLNRKRHHLFTRRCDTHLLHQGLALERPYLQNRTILERLTEHFKTDFYQILSQIRHKVSRPLT